jgi:hypothetical protein
MKAYRLNADFFFPARNLEHAVELEERLFALAEEMGIFWQFGSTDEVEPTDIDPRSRLAQALASD